MYVLRVVCVCVFSPSESRLRSFLFVVSSSSGRSFGRVGVLTVAAFACYNKRLVAEDEDARGL